LNRGGERKKRRRQERDPGLTYLGKKRREGNGKKKRKGGKKGQRMQKPLLKKGKSREKGRRYSLSPNG